MSARATESRVRIWDRREEVSWYRAAIDARRRTRQNRPATGAQPRGERQMASVTKAAMVLTLAAGLFSTIPQAAFQAGAKKPAVSTPRLYVFDCGYFFPRENAPAAYHLQREQVADTRMSLPC